MYERAPVGQTTCGADLWKYALGGNMPPMATSSSGWAGEWIWSSTPGIANTWMRFRKRVTLAKAPEIAPLRIAVDSKYWLWINGQLIVREGALKCGPTPTGSYFDSLDVAPHLRAGENTIAILVWYLGVNSSSCRSTGHGGLCVDGVIRSDASWRLSRDASFLPTEPILFNNQTVLPEWSTNYDARLAEPDWISERFDDSSWAAATAYGVPPVAPFGDLVERPTPLWRDSDLLDYPRQERITSSDGRPVLRCHLPVNLQVYPAIQVDAPAGETITIKVERDWKTTTYHTRAGEQSFEVPAWGNGHYVDYTLPASVTVRRLVYRETGFDCDFSGQFECDDARLNTLWTKSVRSTYLNMRDHLSDCPDRERAQWPGDAVNIAEQAMVSFSSSALSIVRKFLREFIGWRTSDDIIWGPVPIGRFLGTFREFPGQSLLVLASTPEQYLLHSGDVETTRGVIDVATRYLLRHYTVDEAQLVPHRGPHGATQWGPGTQNWYDWGKNLDERLLDNTLYYGAIQSTRRVRAMLGIDDDHSAELEHRASVIERGFDRVFWNGAAYQSPDHAGPPDERGNALAVWTGLARAEHAPALRRTLAEQQHASIYFERFPLEALYLLNDPMSAVDRLTRRYRAEIESSYTTLPEGFGENSNHGWGGAPILLATRHIAGVTPTSPGWRSCRIRPQLGTLQWARVSIPTIHGPIGVSLERHTAQVRMEFELPAPIAAKFETDRPAASVTVETGDVRRDSATGTWALPAGRSVIAVG